MKKEILGGIAGFVVGVLIICLFWTLLNKFPITVAVRQTTDGGGSDYNMYSLIYRGNTGWKDGSWDGGAYATGGWDSSYKYGW